MSEDVRAYLTSKGVQFKTADRKNVHTSCFWCGENPQKRGRLYINVDETAEIPGLFMCHLCGERGSLNKIKRHFGDPVGSDKDPGIAYYDVLAAGASYFHKNLNTHPDAVDYYVTNRGLEHATIKHFKLGWADGKVVPHLTSLGFALDEIRGAGFIVGTDHEFFQDVYTIPYYVGPTCVGIRQKEPGGKYKQPKGFYQRPYNLDSSRGAQEVILTEGEFDAMLCHQMGWKAVMGVPGATQWNESWNGYVRDAKRVWCVFDNDTAGRNGADKIKELIGPRCRALTIPKKSGGDEEDHNDISDWIVSEGHTSTDFANLLNANKNTLLISVAQAMEEWQTVQGVDGIKFNFYKLDQLINPGLLAGEVCVVLAKTGTGKSIWIMNTFDLMSKADPNLKFLFMSLEQTAGDWFERARRFRAFYDLAGLAPTDNTPEQMQAFVQRTNADAYKWWSPRLMLTDKNRMTEEHIRTTLDDYEQEMGQLPNVLAIDYLGYLARGFPGKDRYEKTSEAIMCVKEIAKDYKIPVLLPHQVNRIGKDGQRIDIDSARDSGAVEETGDFVMVLWNPDHGLQTGQTGRTNLYIGKSRHGGKGQEVHYQFAPQTLVLVPEDDSHHKAIAATELKFPHDSWEMAILRHRTGRKDWL